MSRVTVTEVLTGATATAANLNATMNSFVSMSSDVDDNNVRESGLWRQALGGRSLTPTNGRAVFSNAGPSAALAAVASDTLFTVGAAVKVGTVDNSAITDQTIVRLSLAFALSAVAVGATGNELELVLSYSTDDVTYTNIDATRRRWRWHPDIDDAVTGITTFIPRGATTIAHRFTATLSSTLYFRPKYFLNAGTVTFDNVRMMAQVHAK